MPKEKRLTGTQEWCEKTINISLGCSHGCKYCFARQGAVVRYSRVTAEGWETERINQKNVNKRYGKVKNNNNAVYDVMMPSTHDITPATLPSMLIVLKKVLSAGNTVLIVSKPHLDCIKELVEELAPWKAQIAFRFTISSVDDALLKYWEPGAPNFSERLESLQYAYGHGFVTSVSAEPSLYLPDSVKLVRVLEQFVSETIWIGKMNRVGPSFIKTPEDKRMVGAVKEGQKDAVVLEVYQALKNHPKIRWKDSIKDTLKKKFNITV